MVLVAFGGRIIVIWGGGELVARGCYRIIGLGKYRIDALNICEFMFTCEIQWWRLLLSRHLCR